MRVLLVVNGDPGSGPPSPPFDSIIAADGGAKLCLRAGMLPDLIVGDMDSLPAAEQERLAGTSTRFRIHPDPVHKEETDIELALSAAASMQPDEIVMWGVWGDRPDHTLANILALAHPSLRGIAVRAYASGWWFQVVWPGQPVVLEASVGGTLSLIPLTTSVTGIITTGLRYPLPAAWEKGGGGLSLGSGRGISNIVSESPANVFCAEGMILVVYQAARPDEPYGRG